MTTFTREDYEMAARAVGFIDDQASDDDDALGLHRNGQGIFYVVGKRGWHNWNPPEDDGDALRLANRLRICVEFGYCEDDAPVIWVGLIEDRRNWPRHAHFPDPNAATRRAIFRAAIAIGRAMPAPDARPTEAPGPSSPSETAPDQQLETLSRRDGQ